MCAKNAELGGLIDAIRRDLARAKAVHALVAAADVQLMLAEAREQPFSRPGWIFEIKYDGFRVLGARERGDPRILYRRGRDATDVFPEVARALAALAHDDVVLDGEIVVLDAEGRPSFQRMQKRALLTRAPDIGRAAQALPATFFAFDLLACDGFDLRALPLIERKSFLRRILPPSAVIRYTDHIEEEGEALFESARAAGLEGVVGKKADAPYRPGRSADWIKVRSDRSGDFVVVGFSPPRGGRSGFGALHLAVWDGGSLVYAGRVGTGFSEKQLAELTRQLEGMKRATPPCRGTLAADRAHTWVEPRLVCEVRYREWTEEGFLRQPALLRMREDKTVEECVRVVPAAPPKGAAAPPDPAPARVVPFTNLEKVFWPDERYTKGDLIDYYRSVAPWLLPYLADRPIVLTRYPDGIAGKSFFQKDAPDHVPGWIRTQTIRSESADRDIDYFMCDDEPSLLYIINMGTIPLHVWASRVTAIERPDWSILDLDPKGAPFTDVVRVARAIRALCEDIELPSYPKTSGGTGLHVLLPLGAQITHEESRSLGELLANVIVRELPAIATVARAIPARGGRVYVDYLQNGHGKTIAGPLSARPVAGARVSMPLTWRQVDERLDPARFTIKTAPALLAKMKEDPLRRVLGEKPDLAAVLARLDRRLRKGSPRSH